MKNIKPTTYFIVLLLAVIFVLILVIRNKSQKLNISNNNIEAITDTLHTYIDKDGNSVSSIKALQETNLKRLLTIESQDSSIRQLQKAIKDNKKSSSIVVFTGETNISSTSPTTVTKVDTVNKKVWPTYTSNFNLKGWVEGSTLSSKDSTYVVLKIRNSYDVVINKKGEAFVTNHNPYSETTSMRAAQLIAPKPKRFIIGPSIGAQWSFKTNKVEPYVGVGLTYKILSF